MSIKHLENSPINEVVNLLEDISRYSITEKLDGAQLLFGLDEVGFYTSRGYDGRIYSHQTYPIEFHTTYRRSAHIALASSINRLLAAGMVPGDQVEIEVLHGEIPNVVPYSKDTSYIIFLRTTEGNVNIDRLAQEFSGHSLPITLRTPFTPDGIIIDHKDVMTKWEFHKVPEVEIDIDAVKNAISTEAANILADLAKPAYIRDYSRLDILNINLSKIPVNERAEIKEFRTSIDQYFRNYRFKDIKDILLNEIVRNRGSKFGPTDGWIEGVVLKNKETGKMMKLVDKSVFGKAHKFTWLVRSELDLLNSSRSEIVAHLDKYNKEKHALVITIDEIGKTFSYAGEIDRRTLEIFAFRYSQADT